MFAGNMKDVEKHIVFLWDTALAIPLASQQHHLHGCLKVVISLSKT